MKENELERKDTQQEGNRKGGTAEELKSSSEGLKACVVDMLQIQYLQVLT